MLSCSFLFNYIDNMHTYCARPFGWIATGVHRTGSLFDELLVASESENISAKIQVKVSCEAAN